MNKKLIFAVAAMLVATPASAVTLWQNIEHGMTTDQVRALYPAGAHVQHRENRTDIEEFRVTAQCEADVHIYYAGGTVDRVVLRGGGSIGGRCSDTVLTALSSRYGEPLSRDRRERSLLSREGTVYVWNRDGVTLRFKRYTNRGFGGGGLGAASWELTYSTFQDDIAI
jgi:hypothetical protein